MHWIIIVLFPKAGVNYWGIGLLKPFWKMDEMIIDKQFQVVDCHDCLHGFLSGQGTGTTMIESNLAQQFAYLKQEALYMVFIDPRKAYGAMDREQCIKIFENYGVRPNMIRLIEHCW